ncbi:non-ribosomal peptide synthase domain TIGR01720/amino acid adenylation domain-containing protein [Amycolatopsis marina]|uniref:Non-ribosomal peptide synthase domain TIGR01720/amino acid adenylation domain-containing protein n=1 Tax=Amycolatopsis marina TaxID=490629 RepID=A0A1I0XUD6_9PSEU|nr:non-ribosomal peptide synthetase [Amycolatopsis marina]SFB04749.1 non-ribosomal peptide synthase domain TIGR01720/amino acid adenylation domain-containing protein [Amycolatopsis marina]
MRESTAGDNQLGCFADLFESQVTQTPNATAVLSGDDALSYAELNARANQLADLLIEQGVNRSDIVALVLPKSVDAVVATLAVAKTGAAFLPVDPNYPADRITFMLKDAKPARVVTATDVAGRLPRGGKRILLDHPDTLLESRDTADPEIGRELSGVAYVIYTSGSSGTPKGVLVTNSGIASLVRSQVERLGAGPGCRVLQFAPLSFDASVWELCMGLLTGATLVVASADEVQPGAPLVDLVARHDVTHLTLPPSALAVVPSGGLEQVRVLVVAGEAVTPGLAGQWSRGRTLINAYGPTETTVCATMSPPLSGAGDVPIGSAINGARVYVLDDELGPVSPGEQGELYVAGAGLAKGYLNRPELTAERFVQAPFDPAERLYRTGDLVSERADGLLDFHGRIDDQVKVRGFRIEPGEIEAALSLHPGVAQSVVVVRDSRLVAYVVPTKTATRGSELQRALSRRLPEHMVPSRFVVVDALPLSSSGKVDRDALPDPDAAASAGYVAPRNDPEQVIAGIWQEVLRLDRVGIEDNFFEIGGDSLLNIQAVSRMRTALGVDVSPRAVFDNPTVAALASTLQIEPEPDSRSTILVAPRQASMPLSFAQQRLWFMDEFEPGSAEYNVSAGLRLTGPLDTEALRSALDALVARHEILRTTFGSVDGVGVQFVHASGEPAWAVVDLSAAEDLETSLTGLVQAEMQRPFDLRVGPLVRAMLIRAAEQDHVLVLTLHHIVTDRWSMNVLTRELITLYQDTAENAAADLPELPVHYVDYAVWQRDQWTDDALAGDLTYWREQLAGVDPLELPTDRPRPAVRTWHGGAESFALPAEDLDRLKELCGDAGVTLFMTLAAATQVLLARWSGSNDIALGTVTSGRDRSELEDLVGFFVNTVVLRSRIDELQSFTEFVGSVKETVLQAFAHQNVPFDAVVDELAPERDAGRTPLVQAMMVLHNAWMQDTALPSGLRLTEYALPRLTTMFDITVEYAERDGRLLGWVGYNVDLFDSTTIRRMAGHLATLLKGIAAAPRTPVSALPLLGEAEYRQVTREWNDTTVSYPADKCIHELFADQAAKYPDRTAVVYQDEELSYRDIDDRANQLAHHLISLGAGQERPVGLCLRRTPELVVALLGILKAGAAYLPLDPAYPTERLAFVLADAGANFVLTEENLTDLLPDGYTIVNLSEALAAEHSGVDPKTAVAADDLACVLYTSGSTGTPKGVALPHRATVRTFFGTDFLDFGPDHVIPQCMSMSWDGMSLELWGALLHGGTSVLYPGEQTEVERLAELIVRHGATTLCLPQSLFNVLVDEFPETVKRVRQVIVGGDAASGSHLAKARRINPTLRLVNGYGPVESMIVATCHEIITDELSTVPIGRPVANTRVYVLDNQLAPVPIGVAGELCIAGDGLARGYVGRPELTEERFVQAPFDTAERLYRTGDRARWTADGVLEFLGRADEQVKIRGFRVEPGEVEAAIAAHPGVADAVVVPRVDGAVRRLLGYVVSAGAGAGAPDPVEVRDFVRSRLPEYMVPAAVRVLDEFPHTSSGKVDRRALSAMSGPLSAESAYVAARSRIERQLAEIWAEVLGVDRVGVMDNFFELGGDSILSIQVVSRARRTGLVLSSKDMFLRQTIAALAPVVRTGDFDGPDTDVAVGPVELTPVQRSFFEMCTVTPSHYNMSVLLDLADGVDVAALRSAIEAVVSWHDALEMRFERTEDGWRQHSSGERSVVIESAETLDPERVQAGLDLADGPLVRAVLVGHDQLFLTIHHLVVDGVAWRVLLSDLTTAYEQVVAGRQVDLGVRTTSFRRWAGLLAEHARSGGFDDERDYWDSIGPVPDLPRDSTGGNLESSARQVSVRLSAEDTDALLHKVPGVYRTQVNDLLMAALGRVLARWAGNERVLIGMEGHGREDLFAGTDLSRTVGWFTTVYPVALTVPTGQDVGESIKSVKQQLRDVPRRGIGHGALRHLTGTPPTTVPPQISFNYLGRWNSGSDSLIRGRTWNIGTDRGPGNPRQFLLDVVGMVERDQLEFVWIYSADIHNEDTVRRLGDELAAELRLIIEYCGRPGAGGCTPSDFPLAKLDQSAVDMVAGNGRTVEEIYPLTPIQSGMLFHWLINPDAYLGQMAFTLDGVTGPERLGRAWQAVIDRTPILRTSLVWEGLAEPLQVVHNQVELPVTYLDWTGLSEEALGHAAEQYMAADRATGMNLSKAPLTRLTIARLSGNSVWVYCASHHLLLDGWSLFQVLVETFAVHAGIPVTELAARQSFRYYVGWLAEQDRVQAEAHWRDVLAGLESPTPLPFDRAPAESHRSKANARSELVLTTEDTMKLAAFARGHHLTVNTVVQGAWALLLSRYSGERDVCFGTTVAGRPAGLPGAESIIGIFINTLPVRVGVDVDRPVVDWLRDIQARQVEGREYEFVALADMQTWSDMPAGTSLFDSIVVFENYPVDDNAAAEHGLRLRDLTTVEVGTYPLNLIAYAGDELSCTLVYDDDLFDVSTIERLGKHLRTVLDGIVACGDRRIAELPAVDAAERNKITVEWNKTAVSYPRDLCVHQVFEAEVRRDPDAPAVVFGDTVLTYRQLDDRANRLAHHLISLGVVRGTLVGLCVERGVELIVGILGVLKAGAAYVPLDPGYPADRLSFMLTDSAVPVVLTLDRFVGRLPDTGAKLVRLNEELPESPSGPPDTGVTPDDLVYAMYTSGSTGKPRGARVKHRGVVRLVKPGDYCPVGSGDVVAHCASISFDASTFEVWNGLLNGACLAIRPPEMLTVDRIREFNSRHGVTNLVLATGMFHELVDADADAFSGVRQLVVGGDVLSPVHCAKLTERMPDLQVINVYGPTECTSITTVHLVDSNPAPDVKLPIGRPIANTTVYVLDDNQALVPVGAPGEIYIGGDGVGAGYINRPDLNAERFVPNPFVPDDMLYRTGDRARWLPDGTLDFLGRVDTQVKIRGFRIEPGEIEASLRLHPQVGEAVVVAHDDGTGIRRLTAYVVADGPEPSTADLREHTRRTLPEHMVPSTFLVLGQLPLTPNGKVDRRALPDPTGQVEPTEPYEAPRTPAEETLAAIWSELLNVDAVGAHSSFFALGGDSILSIRAVSRVRDAFGVDLSPRDLFDHPTVSGLAEIIEERVLAELEQLAPGE